MKLHDTAQLKAALQPLWDEGKLRLLVIFGSVATGQETNESDLDIGYIPRERVDEVWLTSEIIRLTHWNSVDVVNLYRADPVLAMQIAEKACVMYADDPTLFTQFRSLAFRRFVDTKKIRDIGKRVLDRFLENPIEPK